jgi:hypothetical protein
MTDSVWHNMIIISCFRNCENTKTAAPVDEEEKMYRESFLGPSAAMTACSPTAVTGRLRESRIFEEVFKEADFQGGVAMDGDGNARGLPGLA